MAPPNDRTVDGSEVDESEVRAYYEREAADRARPAMRDNRIAIRDEFTALLIEEGRTSVVDFGAGPGRDVIGFLDADLDAIGVDLAVTNAAIAASTRGRPTTVPVVPGSILNPPFRARSFDAGWSMSTIMHLDETLADRALAEMTTILRPGSPLQIGVWGGDDRYRVDDDTIAGQRRPFHLRSAEVNRALIARWGRIEAETIFDRPVNGQHYQLYRLRTPG